MNVFRDNIKIPCKRRMNAPDGLIHYMILTVVILLGFLTQPVTALGASQETPLYGLYESTIDYQSLTGQSHSYNDPFYGVDLRATFSSPSGRTISWWGFYDGNGQGGQTGNIWKLRYMPDELGTWSYTWQFSDSSASGSGTFDAVSSGARPGPLKHDTDHHWAVSADGNKHVFYNMYALSDIDAQPTFWNNPAASIAEAKSYGFDIIAWTSTLWYPSSNDHYWMNPGQGDYSPRLGMVHKMEALFTEAANQEVYLMDWDGFYVGNGALNLENESIAIQNAAIRYWLARTAPYYNTINNIGFEIPEFFDGNTSAAKSWALERISYFDSVDPWDHFISAHQDGFIGGTYYFPNNPSVDYTGLQHYDYDSYHSDAISYWNTSAEPVCFLSEGLWDGPWGSPSSADQARKAYWDLLTAGCSYFYWPRDNSQGLDGATLVQTFINTSGAKWWLMEPNDDVIASGNARALAKPGSEYIIYSESGNSFSVSLPSGSYSWRWFNPASGQFDTTESLVSTGGNSTFSKPNNNDWVMHITSATADNIAPAVPSGLTAE